MAQLAGDAGGEVIEEQVFRGPLHEQLRAAIRHLQNLSTQHIEKQKNQPEVRGWVSYPLAALEESLVNAVYHRSYVAIAALRDAAHLRAIGDATGAEQRLASAFGAVPGSGVLAAALIEDRARSGDVEGARVIFDRFRAEPARAGDAEGR